MRNNVVFGSRAVIEAIRSGKEIERVLIKRNLEGEILGDLMTEIKQNDVPYQIVPIEKIDRVTSKNHQGVVAFISPVEYQQIEQLVPIMYEQGQLPFFFILDHITDVRNFGAIVRSAECAGIQAIIIPEKGAAQINEDAIKTSAGAMFNVNICRVKSLEKTIRYLIDCGIQVVAATEKGKELYYEQDYTQPTAILMGAEDTGISAELLRLADKLVYIPLQGKIESLNVSSAAAVLAFEVVKQRSI